MIKGIVCKKTGEMIIGECTVLDKIISHNRTTTIVCCDYVARTNDKIISSCNICGKEYALGKRIFITNNHHLDQVCAHCRSIKSKLLLSSNYSDKIDQQLREGTYVPRRYDRRISYRHRKINSVMDQEQLSIFRSKKAKELWADGTYGNVGSINREKIIARMHDLEWKKKWYNSTYTEEKNNSRSDKAKLLWEREEYRRKMATVRKVSKFQLSVQKTLNDSWEMEVPVPNTSFTVDFFNKKENTIIECFGDYWHCNPIKYAHNFMHEIRKISAKEIWDNDYKRIKLLESLGYTVKIIWESDFYKK